MNATSSPDRVTGMLLAAAVGDALGWPQEQRSQIVGGRKAQEARVPGLRFTAWERYAGHYTDKYRDHVLEGEYSDDTQLMLAVARACFRGEGWLQHLHDNELPFWPVYARGGGGAVLRACAAWRSGTPPWAWERTKKNRDRAEKYRQAGANGVAMRIAPHCVVATSHSDLLERVLLDGLLTHGHPRALVGAQVQASLLAAALNVEDEVPYGALLRFSEAPWLGSEIAASVLPDDWGTPQDVDRFSEAWASTVQETTRLLERAASALARGALDDPYETLERLGVFDAKTNGAGTVTAVAAGYISSRFAARPGDGLVLASFLPGADTDTLAAMTGGILGALQGSAWLGACGRTVQDAPYVAEVANRLDKARAGGPLLPHLVGYPIDDFFEAWAGNRDPLPLPDGRAARLAAEEYVADGRVVRARLLTDDGQSLVVDAPAKRIRPIGDTPPTIESGPAEVSGLVLGTRNIEDHRRFWTLLLGAANVRPGATSVRVASWLTFVHEPTARGKAGPVVIEVRVPDPMQVAKRINPSAAEGLDGSVDVVDPDGRVVRLLRY